MDPQKIKALDKDHHIHSWSVQSQLDPMVFDHGLGAIMWDAEGNRSLLVEKMVGIPLTISTTSSLP
jgi:4-aminobutyrate aminotransferase-like enzyme